MSQKQPIEKQKFKCEGCGKGRPCFVEIHQESAPNIITNEDLVCILDATNKTSCQWEEIKP